MTDQTSSRLPGPDELLRIDWGQLQKLPVQDRFRALGDLAETAGAWIADQRDAIVEDLRRTHTDEEAATRLGVSRTTLAEMGDGPTTVLGARPRLLRRTVEMMIEHSVGGSHQRDLGKALELLSAKGRPSRGGMAAAARRILISAEAVPDPQALGPVGARLLGRGLANAAEVVNAAGDVKP